MYKFLAGIFILSFYTAYPQNFTVTNLRSSKIAFTGIDNPMSCIVEGESCKSIVLSTENGTIVKKGCDYIFHPSHIGNTVVTIEKKKSGINKKVGEFVIEVHSFPKPVASVGGRTEGIVKKGFLKAQGGMGCHWPGLGFDLTGIIDSFSVTVFRNNEIIAHNKNYKNSFTETSRKTLNMIQGNDHIVFSGIAGRGADGIKYDLTPIEFIIED